MPANEWVLLSKQAEFLAKADILPRAYRGKPANIIAAALTGRTHGWDLMMAIRLGHVIDGVWGMKPEAMLGLVRAAGHHVDIDRYDTGELEQRGVTVTAHRAGEGDYRFLCTGDVGSFRELGTRFLQMPLGEVERVEVGR